MNEVHSFLLKKIEVLNQVEEYEIYNLVQNNHRDINDFEDGDLGERIEQYKYFNHLKDFDLSVLNKNEWDIDIDLVSKYEEEIDKIGIKNMPPIVIDDKFSIIDGIHRINALLNKGIAKVNVYIGTNLKFYPKKENIERLERAKKQGFDIDTVWYHVSNHDFDTFDINKSKDGCIWLTRDYDSILNNETGASLNSEDIKIHKFYIKASKLGGWDEDDKYFDDQLIQDGYDGLLLDDDIKLFNSENVKKIDDSFLLENKRKTKYKI